MTTRAEMREKVRNFLKDTTTQKASDEELNDYLDYALADYSQHFPRCLVAEYTPAMDIPPPADMLPGESVDAVEVDDTIWPQYYLGATQMPSQCWYWYGENIRLSEMPSRGVRLHYRGLHAFVIPQGKSYDEAELTVPLADEELILLYTAAKFHQKVGTIAAKLDRFRERGERDDNPLIMMHDLLMQQYQQKIDDRIRRGTFRLRRVSWT